MFCKRADDPGEGLQVQGFQMVKGYCGGIVIKIRKGHDLLPDHFHERKFRGGQRAHRLPAEFRAALTDQKPLTMPGQCVVTCEACCDSETVVDRASDHQRVAPVGLNVAELFDAFRAEMHLVNRSAGKQEYVIETGAAVVFALYLLVCRMGHQRIARGHPAVRDRRDLVDVETDTIPITGSNSGESENIPWGFVSVCLTQPEYIAPEAFPLIRRWMNNKQW